MTDQNAITFTISVKNYSELLIINQSFIELIAFFDEFGINFPATDLTPALFSLSSRLSAVVLSFDKSVTKLEPS